MTTNPREKWGLPCWQEASTYGDQCDWSNAKWCWEFLRRREDYRSHTIEFFKLSDVFLQAKLLHEKQPTDDTRLERDRLYDERKAQFHLHWKKWGFSPILHPSHDHPEEHLHRWPHGGVASVEGGPVDQSQKATLGIEPHELGVTINLDRPLPEQLKIIRRLAREAQTKRHGKQIQNRTHQTKWLTYLRVLDARECGASWAEISAILPNTQQTEQTARDTWNQAHTLCFSF